MSSVETFSLSSEQSLVGALINDPHRIDDLACSAEDFYHYGHKQIFMAIQRMAEMNLPIDNMLLAEFMDKQGTLSEIGGWQYIMELATNSAGSANVKRYAQIIKDKSLIRELIAAANAIAERAATSTDSAENIVSEAEAEIFKIMDKRETSEPVHIETAVNEAVKHFGDVVDGLTYQSTGLVDLDSLLGGLRGGATYVIAARPSMGKTALMCSIAHHIAKDQRCYIATLEMPRREIASRLIAIDANLNIGDVANWDDDDYNKLAKGASTVRSMNIIIDEEEGLTLAKLRARTRRMKRRGGLGCIFVDYLQLMKSKADSREREIALLSAGIKSLAKELDVPVVMLAQLNRDCDKRQDKRPLMSDLRESGSVEQDADVIVMLYRDEVYNKDSQYKGMAELLVRKNRHGSIGDVYTTFQAHTMAFKNKADDWMIPDEPAQTPRRRGFYDD